jgi:hypothetical protein
MIRYRYEDHQLMTYNLLQNLLNEFISHCLDSYLVIFIAIILFLSINIIFVQDNFLFRSACFLSQQ